MVDSSRFPDVGDHGELQSRTGASRCGPWSSARGPCGVVCVGAVAFRLRDRSEVDQTLCWTYPQANQLTPYICRAVTSPFLPCFDPVRQFFFVMEPMMGNCVEGEARELQVPTAALHCPKCKGYARL